MGNITPKDYTQILSKGLESSLASTPIEDGKIRYCTDTGRVYLDQKSDGHESRIRLSDIEDSSLPLFTLSFTQGKTRGIIEGNSLCLKKSRP